MILCIKVENATRRSKPVVATLGYDFHIKFHCNYHSENVHLIKNTMHTYVLKKKFITLGDLSQI